MQAISFTNQAYSPSLSPLSYDQDGIEFFPSPGVSTNSSSEVERNAQKLAKEQGFPVANFFLGRCFDTGEGVPRNLVQAAEYYYAAAEGGLAEAQHDLACCFLNGEGVTADLKTAIHYFLIAAEQGYVPAVFHLGNIMERKDPAKAAILYRQAADRGYAQAYFRLGCMCDNGYGVNQNYAQAAEFYFNAASLGLPEAQFNLACSYELGQGVAQNLHEAVKWYTTAADLGHSMAQFNLAQCYHHGKGVIINEAGAIHYYRMASQQGIAVPDLNELQRPRSVSFPSNLAATNSNRLQPTRPRSVSFQQGNSVSQPFVRSDYRNNVFQRQQEKDRQVPSAPRASMNAVPRGILRSSQQIQGTRSLSWGNGSY